MTEPTLCEKCASEITKVVWRYGSKGKKITAIKPIIRKNKTITFYEIGYTEAEEKNIFDSIEYIKEECKKRK